MEDLAGGQLKMPKLSIETFARILNVNVNEYLSQVGTNI